MKVIGPCAASLLIAVTTSSIVTGQGGGRSSGRTIPRPGQARAPAQPAIQHRDPNPDARPLGTLMSSQGSLQLLACLQNGAVIECRFEFIPAAEIPRRYHARSLFKGNTLVDDLQRPHRVASAHFRDGNDQPLSQMTLAVGQRVQFVQEFTVNDQAATVHLYASGRNGLIGGVHVGR